MFITRRIIVSLCAESDSATSKASAIEKVHKQKSAAALVAIRKRMVLDHKVQQVGRLELTR